jgi:aminoglycoside 6'-N-acetyltransferase
MMPFTAKFADATIDAGGGVSLTALRRCDDAFLQSMLDDDEVSTWFDAAGEELVALIDEPTVSPFLIHSGGAPAGYAQIYWANGDAFWRDIGMPAQTMGFDLSLSSAFRNQGLGPRVIDALIARAFAMTSVVQAITNPDPDNARAIRAYSKCGFVFGPPQPGYYGDPMLLGRLRREDWRRE